MSLLTQPFFHNELAATEKVESIVWPLGPTCPRCKATERISVIKGKGARVGLKYCGLCRKQFHVRVGTIFEGSHIPLYKWLQAIFLLASSKKGISSHQLHRVLQITYKSAWFMTHRIREAMRADGAQPLMGMGGIVEVDETFIGNNKETRDNGKYKGRGYAHKHKILTLVERGGRTKSVVIEGLTAKTIVPILQTNISSTARIFTDDAGQYRYLSRDFQGHDVVRHSRGEYVRGKIHTNTIEGFFSIFKRGMKGTYQHCGKRHLPRYLAEFDFRYNERQIQDDVRADRVISGSVGKRLTYRHSLPALG